MTELDSLQERIGYRFDNPEWLRRALARSAARGSEGIGEEDIAESEHLSWLGDAVLYLAVSKTLLSLRPMASTKELSTWRIAIVDSDSLGDVAERFRVREAIRVADSLRNNPQAKDWHVMLSEALEGIFGAIYRDSGFSEAEAAVRWVLKEKIAETVGRS